MLGIQEILENYSAFTVLTHINPDPDTIGTALGIYTILKNRGKRVEVANFSMDIPFYLDFLPHFSKIKSHMDFEESLVITCDAGSLDRLGFDLSHRDIMNIDHHKTNEMYGLYNFVDSKHCSAGGVAFELFKEAFPIHSQAATCFYTALLSDTQNFTTSSVGTQTFDLAQALLQLGANHNEISQNLTKRRSLASVRIQAKALEMLELHSNATIATVKIDARMMQESGAKMSDIAGIVDIACSLATVEVAILLVIFNSQTKVSLRSKTQNLTHIAQYFGGGGHPQACGFECSTTNLEEVLDKILLQLRSTTKQEKEEKQCEDKDTKKATRV